MRKVIVFFKTSENHSRLFHRFISLIRDEDLKCHEINLLDYLELPFSKVFKQILKTNTYNKVLKKYRKFFWIFFLPFLLSRFKNFLRIEKVSTVVFLDQYIDLRRYLVSKLTNKHEIPLIMIPFVVQHIEDIKIARSRNKKIIAKSKGVFARTIWYLLPSWRVKGYDFLLWANPLEILILSIYGVKSPTGALNKYLNKVFVQCSLHKDRLVRFGLDSHKVEITGDVVFDLFYKHKEKLISQKRDESVIVFSSVPDLGTKTFCGSYIDYLKNYVILLNSFKLKGWNVICNPHPSTTIDAIKYFEENGFKISKDDISSAIIKADLYLTSYSSTIFFALALGIPSINHDIYDFKYLGYNEFSGVEVVEFNSNIKQLIDEKVFDKARWDEWKNKSKSQADLFGNQYIDGKVLERILGSIF